MSQCNNNLTVESILVILETSLSFFVHYVKYYFFRMKSFIKIISYPLLDIFFPTPSRFLKIYGHVLLIKLNDLN